MFNLWEVFSRESAVFEYVETMYRSIRPEVFFQKGVLRNFAKFTGKHLCQSLFFNKVAGLKAMAQTLRETGTGETLAQVTKRLWQGFPVNFVKFLRAPFLQNYSWRLLLESKHFAEFYFLMTSFESNFWNTDSKIFKQVGLSVNAK